MYYSLLVYWRRLHLINDVLFFFLIAMTLEALCQTIPSGEQNLHFLWLCLLFSGLLSLEYLFQQDKENGVIDIILLQPQAKIFGYIYQQISSHFLINIGPILVFYIPVGLLLHIPLKLLCLSLPIFTISIIGLMFLASIAASLRLSNKSNFLRFILILPLSTPLWIFAFGIIKNFQQHRAILSPCCFLIALSLAFIIIGPIVCNITLRYLND